MSMAGELSGPGPPHLLEELEPQLKYEQLGADVRNILAADTVTCLCLSDKILAMGTAKGRVHVLDYSGNEVGMVPSIRARQPLTNRRRSTPHHLLKEYSNTRDATFCIRADRLRG